MEQLHGRLSGDQISLVQDVLVLTLDRYEVQERCTEVSVCAHSSEELLRRFVATKRVEGIAETTLRRLGKTAGVDDVHPHRYRRTLATNLLDRGMPMQDVAAILGHADLKTTQIYCYISQSNVRQAYFKLVS